MKQISIDTSKIENLDRFTELLVFSENLKFSEKILLKDILDQLLSVKKYTLDISVICNLDVTVEAFDEGDAIKTINNLEMSHLERLIYEDGNPGEIKILNVYQVKDDYSTKNLIEKEK